MKKIGLVGGLGWPSTAEYYAMICRMAEQQIPQQPLELSIESLDLGTALSLIGGDDDESWSRFDRYHREAVLRLQMSGARIAALASNTPHHRFGPITSGIDIPVINVFDSVAQACARKGIDALLVIGTQTTMASPIMRRHFERNGIRVGTPPSSSYAEVTALIESLQFARCEGARERLALLARDYHCGAHTAVALACTELPLAFPGSERTPFFAADGIYYANTAAIHAQAIFERAIGS